MRASAGLAWRTGRAAGASPRTRGAEATTVPVAKRAAVLSMNPRRSLSKVCVGSAEVFLYTVFVQPTTHVHVSFSWHLDGENHAEAAGRVVWLLCSCRVLVCLVAAPGRRRLPPDSLRQERPVVF